MTGQIDAETGGSVENSAGVRLEVPPGALAEDATATIEPKDDGVYDVRLDGEWDGLVTVQLPIVDPDSPDSVHFLLHNVDGEWLVEEADRIDRFVVAEVDHLSDFFSLKCIKNPLSCLAWEGVKWVSKTALKKVIGEDGVQEILELCYNPLDVVEILFLNDCAIGEGDFEVPQTTSTSRAPSPPDAQTPAIALGRGEAAPAGFWYSVVLSGFSPGSSVTVTCRDSVDPQGFWTQTFTIGGDGRASDSTLCHSADGPDHWVTGGGVESNHVTR